MHADVKTGDELEAQREERDPQEVHDFQGNGEEPESAETADEKIAELNDRYLRLYSEFDNYRRRTLKEKIELSKTASADLITGLLPILDDFERAIRAFSETNGYDSSLKEGVILIYNKFLTILTQKGLEQMKTIGEPFDTDFHEAITNVPAPSPDLKGKVVDEVEKGYLLNGKVIRYAKVVVGN
ncbi:MAG: nucleotide exchange factor GrpE [Bacteroidetes bacterium]|nr:MAG: nucleotide exchange factor GrpE [Bacteroidota bacterium]